MHFKAWDISMQGVYYQHLTSGSVLSLVFNNDIWHLLFYMYTLPIGTKSDMLRMEKAYIDGRYTPFEDFSKS